MNYIVWFDIPVTNLDKASQFYSEVLSTEIKPETFDGGKMGVFPHDEKSGVAGCLFESKDSKPSDCGPLLYFNVNGRLEEAVAAVKQNGGEILQDKHQIGPFGFRAIVKDPCGNRIALHSE